MLDTDHFQFDHPRVISEVMDGELVLVQFESGCYYSVRGVGADVCQLLTAGHDVGHIAHSIATRHQASATQVHDEVRKFIADLVAEKLLVPQTTAGGIPAVVTLGSTVYTAPAFEKFDDMADQLLLDPIHEIGETGWPLRKAG
ncbi:MAG: PqqD family protein [Planctomycetia bacterium]|nr:PqqD family protein [Planctomycetia bacterium]